MEKVKVPKITVRKVWYLVQWKSIQKRYSLSKLFSLCDTTNNLSHLCSQSPLNKRVDGLIFLLSSADKNFLESALQQRVGKGGDRPHQPPEEQQRQEEGFTIAAICLIAFIVTLYKTKTAQAVKLKVFKIYW